MEPAPGEPAPRRESPALRAQERRTRREGEKRGRGAAIFRGSLVSTGTWCCPSSWNSGRAEVLARPALRQSGGTVRAADSLAGSPPEPPKPPCHLPCCSAPTRTHSILPGAFTEHPGITLRDARREETRPLLRVLAPWAEMPQELTQELTRRKHRTWPGPGLQGRRPVERGRRPSAELKPGTAGVS